MPHKFEDLNSEPRTHMKSWASVIPVMSRWRAGQQISALWAANLAHVWKPSNKRGKHPSIDVHICEVSVLTK